MKPDISEFSYGYALTAELSSGIAPGLVAAPVFPSLRLEGQTGGYDVKIPTPRFSLFLQFKLSEFINSRRATECMRGLLDPPFYRFDLRSKRYSRQHELLLDLEDSEELVFYAAPAFHKVEQLDDAYLSQKVFDRSVFVPPSEIGQLPDLNPHRVSFSVQAASYKAFFLSDPVDIDILSGRTFSHLLVHRVQSQTQSDRDLDELGAQLASKLLQLLRQHDLITPIHQRIHNSEMSAFGLAAYLSQTYLGCQLYVIGWNNP